MSETMAIDSMADASTGARPTAANLPFELGSFERAFGCLARHYQNYLDITCSAFGLSSSQVPLMIFLAQGHSGSTQNYIARSLGVDKGTVSRNVRALVEQGMITQSECLHDTRACTIELTENGRMLADQVARVSSRWTDTVTSGLTEKQRMRFLSALGDMAGRAEVLNDAAAVEQAQIPS